MSTVDKMLIKGIRSFDPENKHVITFYKPLTLIVGPNGAGKTTIIEGLKYACTGELPPNARSGHSFIHDPKVAGETETKAQIKLRFKTAAGKDVVCIRSFQLTQKASKMEYKAIESVLQTINPHTGEKVCLSYRCADMDREVPVLMGVSKAVLENVIFVHQDDANWPLQDPSTLKKKFDDIFSATRYTKALEVIKKLHKDQAQEIKTYKLKLENLQTLKDAAFKLRESIAQDQERTESFISQMQELEQNIQNVERKISSTETTLKELQAVQDEISIKDTKRSMLFKLQQTQYANLAEENEDTDEDLKEWQSKFEEKIAQLESKIRKLERHMNDVETESTLTSQQINASTREIAKLQAEAEGYEAVKHERDTAIQKFFSEHNLGPLPNLPLSNEVAFNLINQAKMRLMDLETDLLDKKKASETELKSLWDRYVGASNQCSESEGQRQAKIAMKVSILKQIEEKENERDEAEIELSNHNLSRIDEKEKNTHMEVERKSTQLKERNYEFNINQKQLEISSLDQRIKGLYRDKDVMASDSEDRVKLDVKRDELEGLKKKHKKIVDEHKDKIKSVLKGRFPSDKDIKKEITHALSLVRQEYDDLNSKSHEAEREMKLVQMKREDLNNNLNKFHKDMEAKRRFIDSKLQALAQISFEVESFPKVLLDAMEKRDAQKSNYDAAKGMKDLFEPFESSARLRHACPCCDRGFSLVEEDEFVEKQRTKSKNADEIVNKLAADFSKADLHFQQLDRLRVVYEEFVKLKKETAPLAEKNLKELDEEWHQKSQAFDDLQGLLVCLKVEKDSVEILVPQVENADRLLHEMTILKEQIEDLEYKLDARGQGNSSMEEIQSQITIVQNKRDSLNMDIEKLRQEHTYMQNDLSNMQMRWHALREEKLKALAILDKFKRAEKELERLHEEKAQVELNEKHLEETVVPLSKEKEKLLRDHRDLRSKLEHEHEGLAKIKNSYEQGVQALLKLAFKIKEYLDSKKGERLAELQEKHHRYESKKRDYDVQKQEISADLNKSKEVLRNQDQLKRNIDDNLNYRRTKADVDQLTQEIQSLEDKKEKIGGVSIFEADLRKHIQERERLLSELNRCQGTLSVYHCNISRHKLDLKQAQYNDIDKRYFNQLIQLKTTEMANKDLDRYYNALDKALMRFHTMKMEEINKIIRELWQQTYRGQDIDYISILSDSDGVGTRSYSYRVIMQTGDAELEMRGRCSAGQKVLASLIIRLALAETFCLNCGILALDEPTTNLDGPNAESLASALLRIMEDRKGQENFQLIVITHDERFAQLIGQRQHAERYYRVTKDEHQHSIIEAQEIFD
ncbi:DNA repair protein RAD50 isoform X2 [Aristolochia californica]|uniref:DNA repair protein RAD50 isoform X2 n=1 Tax=Aristolochia californica TaxID=171875 RepID=UPI0035E23474